MPALTRDDLEALALRCVREKLPLWELATALKEADGREIDDVMFGPCVDGQGARSLLFSAQMAAIRPYSWKGHPHH